jgi:CubicO group peptidase (beta-lactamase class C family)
MTSGSFSVALAFSRRSLTFCTSVGRLGGKEIAMTWLRRWWLCSLSVLLATACLGCQTTAPPPTAPVTTLPSSASTSASAPPSTNGLDQAIDDHLATGSVRLRTIRTVLVSQRNQLIAERYYDSNAAEYVEVQSVTKSVISTLIGIALASGDLTSLDQNLGQLLPQHRATMAPTSARVTLRQLLTMTSGWTDQVDPEPTRPKLVERILRQGPDGPTGTFTYANIPVQLLSAVLVKATGQSTLDYARRELFDPLGIKSRPAYEGQAADVDKPAVINTNRFRWLRDPDGIHAAPFGLALTALDMVKIGELWLNQGEWQGKRLLAADYIADASRNLVPELDQTRSGYGYLWWDTPLATEQAFSAQGQYGQLITVIPDLRAVIVVSSRASENPPTPDDLQALVDTIIVPRLR